MNEQGIKTYAELVNEFNLATDHGGHVPRSFGYDLLEQIRLRDSFIEWCGSYLAEVRFLHEQGPRVSVRASGFPPSVERYTFFEAIRDAQKMVNEREAQRLSHEPHV